MAVFNEDKDRKVIPRWRPFLSTLNRNELGSLKNKSVSEVTEDAYFTLRKTDWKHHRKFAFAADLVSSGVVLNRAEECHEAAKFILEHSTDQHHSITTLARHVLFGESISQINSIHSVHTTESSRLLVHNLRSHLAIDPHNTFAWVDLSLAYETLGIREKAQRSMDIALKQAPDNRFVLRSAARLYIHQDDISHAHDLLKNTQRTMHDPWLLSAEIAISSALGRTSRNIGRGKKILESENYPHLHTSELASAIATLELFNDKKRRAEKLLKLALINPTENTIAQTGWLDRKFGLHRIHDIYNKFTKSYEASAWSMCKQGEWQSAVNESLNWFSDQPFSSRPAILGSYILSTCLNDYTRSAEIAKIGLVANPGNITLLNNLSFSLAMSDNLDEAKKIFSKINVKHIQPEQYIVWSATQGLLLYRSGKADEGKSFYNRATDLASRAKDNVRFTLASIYLALEEKRINSSDARMYGKIALDAANKLNYIDFEPLVKKLRETFD